jgi:hypothetical protein
MRGIPNSISLTSAMRNCKLPLSLLMQVTIFQHVTLSAVTMMRQEAEKVFSGEKNERTAK